MASPALPEVLPETQRQEDVEADKSKTMANSSDVVSTRERKRENSPKPKSLQDLTIIESWDPGANTPKYVTFYFITDEEEVYFGQSFKKKKDIKIEEYASLLKRIPDEEIFPEIPSDTHVKIAPEHLKDSAYIKRPGLNGYESMKGTNYITKNVLDETLIMERLSENPHPNIIPYFGCRVKRNRITAILLQKYESTLRQCSWTPEFEALDQETIYNGVKSAIEYLHSLGLAHNDISPDNIMLSKDNAPIVIDLGSSAPFGAHIESGGTTGWYDEELLFRSSEKHDLFALDRLREWMKKPE